MSRTRTTTGGQRHASEAPASKPPMTALPPGPQNPALVLAAALGAALDNRAWQPACARCVARAKTSGDETLRVPQALTWQGGEPVCYGAP